MKDKKYLPTISYSLSAVLLLLYFFLRKIISGSIHPLVRLGVLALSCIMFYVGYLSLKGRLSRKGSKRLKTLTLLYAFAMYLIFVLTLTWADEFYGRVRQNDLFIWDLSAEEKKIYFKTGLQTELFATVKRMLGAYEEGRITLKFLVRNIVGNTVILMPLGYFLPKLFKTQRNALVFVLSALAFTLIIEAVQLTLMIGVCDIDDIFLNLAGAVAVYIFTKIPIFKIRD